MITTQEINSMRSQRDIMREMLSLQQECAELSSRLMMNNSSHVKQIRRITEIVGLHFGVSLGEITGPSRVYRIALARHVAWYFIRNLLDAPLSTIGTAFNKDHSAVIYGAIRVSDLMEVDKAFNQDIQVIASTINKTMTL